MLAGHTLTFDVEVVAVREATAEEQSTVTYTKRVAVVATATIMMITNVVVVTVEAMIDHDHKDGCCGGGHCH